ncbi:hypothetical protein AVEN_176389-1 [Araneus ventricosus]|uniref:Uncharacterized protein n=1 Tax=Araneus ventricosus TaxID=182803 RepID=A0A4Y2C6Z2_ARAVE|nr:hypothetical protein AVEN_176389-1 [Araneus ventricosus]
MINKPHLIADEGNLNQSGRLILYLGEMANTVCCAAVDPTTEAHTSLSRHTSVFGFHAGDYAARGYRATSKSSNKDITGDSKIFALEISATFQGTEEDFTATIYICSADIVENLFY